MITKKQLKQIEEIIRKRFISFRHDTSPSIELSSEELKILKDAGILRKNVKSFVGDSHVLGKMIARISPKKRTSMTYDEVLRTVGRPPLSASEKSAIEFAESSAGAYITTLEKGVIGEVKNIISNSISQRKTISEITTDLFSAIDKSNIDFRKIAHTETNNALQRGIRDTIKEAKGKDALVYKIVTSKACEQCKSAYLSGGKPRVFKLSELEESNFGKRMADWEPCILSHHPNCSCQLVYLPDNYEFDEEGNLVYKK